MSSRDKILAAIKQAQPAKVALPELNTYTEDKPVADQFAATLQAIGGHVEAIADYAAIEQALPTLVGSQKRIVSTIPALTLLQKSLLPALIRIPWPT